MRTWARIVAIVALVALAIAPAFAARPDGKGKPGGETAGNNLSYPVIWAEGVTKVLRGDPGEYTLNGTWWYWWGTDPATELPLSCAPDPDGSTYCDDGMVGTVGTLPGDGWLKVYLQQDTLNAWQADSFDAAAAPVVVDWVDWGDNLESSDWTLRSQVRTEVVLIQDLAEPMLQFGMRHLYGWGVDEMWGLATTAGIPESLAGVQATVYSHCARLTLQKLVTDDPADPDLACLDWAGGEAGWVDDACAETEIAPPMWTGAVYAGADGPGYYSAEINVKGKIIYGYTWNVRKMNEGAGLYRITFNFDETCGPVTLNTSFEDGTTEILVPLEEEVTAAAEEGGATGGGTAYLDFGHNLTYIDVRILPKGR